MTNDLHCQVCRDWLWPLGPAGQPDVTHWFALACHYVYSHPVSYQEVTGLSCVELAYRAGCAGTTVTPGDYDRLGRICAGLVSGDASDEELVGVLGRMTPAGRRLAHDVVVGAGLLAGGPTAP